MSLRLATLMVASAVVHGAALTAPFVVRREPSPIMVELASHPLPRTAAGPVPRRGDPASPALAPPRAPAELPPAPDSPVPFSAGSDRTALPDEPSPPRSLPAARLGAPDLASPAVSRRVPPPLDGGRPLLADRGSPPVPARASVAEDVSALALPGPEARRLASPSAPGRPSLPAAAVGLGPGGSKVMADDRGREALPAVSAGDAGIPLAAIARLIGSRSGGGAGAPGEAASGDAGGASEGRGPNRTAPTSIAGAPEGGDERDAPAAPGDGTRAADTRSGAREGAEGRSGDALAARLRGNPSPLTVAGGVGPGPAPAEYGSYLRQLRSQIEDTIKYPLAARRRRLAGTVLVELVVSPRGEIEHVAVVGSSSHALLDNAAIDAIHALHPLPFPAELPRRPLRVRLPIVFDFR
ncbi:MAG: hypothetical protein DME09_04125 [Candidatus Rokuibacteriota bacterium]|nr:MAG: hypothetical protein DME09_04125 [Candidatus Rokubacteria bacterium]